MERTLAIVVSDLMFQSRIAEATGAAGFRGSVADTTELVERALAAAPNGVVVDLHIEGVAALDVIRRATGAGVGVLAFGRHTEPQVLRAARDAGAHIVVPRSQLVEDLPGLLSRLVDRSEDIERAEPA